MNDSANPAWEKGRRIYVAGPMQGLPEHGYPAFIEACRWLRMRGGWDVVSPHELQVQEEGKNHWEYMRLDIAALATCEAIALLDGWTRSRGAVQELNAALAMGLEIWRFDRTGYAPDTFYRLD